MNLEEKLMVDLKEAMKAKDPIRLKAIRAIKSAIMLLKTDGTGEEITNEKEIALLQKMVKQRKESLEIYEKQNRPELAIEESSELEVIMQYLPKQLNESEVSEVIASLIKDLGATSMKDMGKVIGAASAQLAGKAEGKMIADLVKKLLA